MNGDPFTGDIEELVMQPNDVLVATATYEVMQEDLNHGQVDNHAEVEGTPTVPEPNTEFDDIPVTDEDNENVPGELEPEISLTKSADKKSVIEAGETVTYTFEVTNTGNTTLTDVTLNDPMLGGEITLDETTLQPGESTTVEVDYEVTQDDILAGEILNEADVEGTPPPAYTENPDNPDKVTDEDDNQVLYSALLLEKTSNKEEVEKAGEVITYTFEVTNIGKTTLENIVVNDEMLAELGIEVELEQTTLNPGESTTGTFTHQVTQEDLDNGEIHNFADTEGTPPPVIDPEDPENPVEQDPVTDEDDEKVTGEQTKALELEKEADEQEVEKAGDTITYTLTVTNTGNVTLDNVTVNDEMLGGDLEVTPSTLKPGEQGTVTGTYEVTQEDIDLKDEIENIATATGTPPGGDPDDPDNPKTPPVEEDVPVVNDPEISLVKQADKEKLVEGETVTYTFTATNVGNVTLENVHLTDELEGLSDIDYLTVNDETITDPHNITLKPGDVLVATATYEVTQEDVDNNKLYNHATVEGTPPAKENPEDPDNPIEQNPVTDDDDEKVPSEQKPEITLEKSTNKEEVTQAGDVITYKFVVTNTGNVTLEDVKVNDPMLDAAGVDIVLDTTTLKPGESTEGQAVYTVIQEDIDSGIIKNIATSTGTPPGNDPDDPENPVSPPDEVEVPAKQEPNISLEKLSDIKTVTKAGQKVTYTFVVINTGNTTLENLILDDPMLGGKITLPQTTLAPGEKLTVKQSYYVTEEDLNNGEINNIAKVTGQIPGEDPTTVEDEDTETIQTEKTGETLPKTATNHYTLLAIGFAFLLAGLSIIYFRRRNQA